MNEPPSPDPANGKRALSPALKADLAIALDLAIRDPQSSEIAPVMARVADGAAAEQVRPEELLLCLKAIWREREPARTVEWLPADRAWLALVRTLMNAYYATGETGHSGPAHTAPSSSESKAAPPR